MTQTAPDPAELRDLVTRVRYRNGWKFALGDVDRGQGSAGLTLAITVTGPDSYHPQRTRSVVHYMIVPAAAYDRRAWRWWLFEQCQAVDQHEAGEFFRFTGDDGTEARPFPPNHSDGRNPYQILELGTIEDAETDSGGTRHPGTQGGRM